MGDVKLCRKCNTEKPLTDFYIRKERQKPRERCKVCVNRDNVARQASQPEKATARTNAWRKANPGRATAISRAWQLRNPEQVRAQALKRKYGITDFNAIWQTQGGLCASCGKPMLREGREKDSVCVDHDRTCCPGHKSCGKCVRGLIHWSCNLVLGYAKDNPEVLQKAIDYLRRWESREAQHSTDTDLVGEG